MRCMDRSICSHRSCHSPGAACRLCAGRAKCRGKDEDKLVMAKWRKRKTIESSGLIMCAMERRDPASSSKETRFAADDLCLDIYIVTYH
jgi:hypothetical protein